MQLGRIAGIVSPQSPDSAGQLGPIPSAQNKLQWLEAMRALAACWVLVHHANQSVSAFVGPMGSGTSVIGNGYLGVDFFFVLSGFIIAYSSNRMLDSGRGFKDYARSRLIRIYVPYLPIGIAMLLLYMALPGMSGSDRTPGVLSSLTLLPSNSPPALSVAWTLIHELLFYALFSLIFVSHRLLWMVLAMWAISIICFLLMSQQLPRGWNYLLSPLNLCFLLGVALHYVTRRGVRPALAFTGGAIALLILIMEAGQAQPNRALLALAFAGFILLALSTTAQRQGPGKSLLFVGAASYSIYLVHGPIISLAVRLIQSVSPQATPWVAFLLISVAGFSGGLAYFFFYERHALRLARRRSASSVNPAIP